MVYRLDAMEAYNKRLVKKIAVKGISESGSTATDSYVYLESVNLSNSSAPTATLQFDVKQSSGTKQKSRIVTIGDNLYAYSNGLEEYKNGFVMWPIRTAVSGKQMTPGGATELMALLGKEESIARIEAAIAKLQG